MFSFTPLLNKTRNKPIYKQLYESIKEQILNGFIPGGTKLPSIRKLSKDLNLSKNTIEAAYQQLYAEGFVESIPKIGYLAVDIHLKLYEPSAAFESKAMNCTAPRHYKYDLTSKHGDVSCININAWKKIANSIMNEELQDLLSYGDHQGERELREEIAKFVYETRGAYCDPDQIIVGAGTQYCLNLLCQMLRPDYDTIAMEEPGSNWIRFIFQRFQFALKPVAYEQNGLDIKQLKNSNAKIVFVTPSHQILKGTIMPAANRIELLNWAYHHDGIIIEDDYDSEIKHLSNAIPSLKSLDKNEHVVYLGSFSKIFIPSIRISYMILPPRLLDLYLDGFKMYEQTTSKLHQKTLARFMKEGYWQKHVRKIKKLYLNKYKCIKDAVQLYMQDKVQFIRKNGGLSILVEIRTSLTEMELVTLAEEAGIHIVPVSEYFLNHIEYRQIGFPKLLLAFKGIPIEDIEPAIKRLSEVWFKE